MLVSIKYPHEYIKHQGRVITANVRDLLTYHSHIYMVEAGIVEEDHTQLFGSEKL